MKFHKLVLSLFAIVCLGSAALAQGEARKSPHDTLKTKNITVTYGRPSMKGRKIFGDLVPYGQVYRCGADEATTITFAKDGKFGGKPVKAGTYALFVIPNEKQWTIILNGNPKQWGAYDYDKNKAKDVLHTDVPVAQLSAPMEKLTIDAPGNDLTIAWEKTKVAIPVSF